jgi:hypothetical protein
MTPLCFISPDRFLDRIKPVKYEAAMHILPNFYTPSSAAKAAGGFINQQGVVTNIRQYNI